MDKSSIILDVQGFSKEGINPIPKEVLEEKIIKKQLNGQAGIYLLFNNDELVYIGSSGDLYNRVESGHNGWTRLKGKWNKFAYIKTATNKEAREIESILIHICKPKYNNDNGTLPTNEKLKRLIDDYRSFFNGEESENENEIILEKPIKTQINDFNKLDISKIPSEISNLLNKIEEKILSKNNISKVQTKAYISYKIDKKPFISIRPRNQSIKIWLNFKYGELEDKYNITRNVSHVGHLGVGQYEIKIEPNEQEKLQHLFELIDQAYDKFIGG